jgi:GR25 family glycosyltransferase involved in LPS biosynthesis
MVAIRQQREHANFVLRIPIFYRLHAVSAHIKTHILVYLQTSINNVHQYKMHVFSFCIYGKHKKYCEGLLENLRIIEREFPDYDTWIYAGIDVPDSYIEAYKRYRTKIIFSTRTLRSDVELMTHRFFPLDDITVEVMFVRDADSRINGRDLWCIRQFLQSNKMFHIIRDNYWHKGKRIPGGLWGARCPRLRSLLKRSIEDTYNAYSNGFQYGTDELILEPLYNVIKDDVLIHSDIVAFGGETVHSIDHHNDGKNFAGNVIEYDENGREYPSFDYYEILNKNIREHLSWLNNQKSWNMVVHLWKDIQDLDKYGCKTLYSVLDECYIAHFWLSRVDECQRILKLFQRTHVDEHIIDNSNHLFGLLRQQGTKIVATVDPHREPKDNEIVIVYGNYLHDYNNLPHSNKVYRHAIYYNMVRHDYMESHLCWRDIDVIYILNLEERRDRYMEIMVELCRMGAPLNRVHHYKAKKESVFNEMPLDAYIGATKNHYDVVKDFLNHENYNNCLILEDDLTFTSNIRAHQQHLAEFFNRRYDFDICLISSSKYGETKHHDDLLSLSFQECTTSSGYILNHKTAHRVLHYLEEGYERMKETKDYHKYVVDRYWKALQKDRRFFLFNEKMGYQRCNYSSITKVSECHFD